jgi:erythromycin esterase
MLIVAFFTNSCKELVIPDLNLGFETINKQNNKPIGWDFYESGYQVTLDHECFYNGKYSLRIAAKPDIKISKYPGGANLRFDNIQNNQKIKVTGFIKNESTTRDTLGLFIRCFGSNGDIAETTTSKNFIGSHDWQEYSVELTNIGQSDYFVFGIIMTGNGKIWVDNIKLFIDNKEITKQPQSNFHNISPEEIKWLKDHCIPIKTTKAENGFLDLEYLKQSLKDVKIVALGENTHGTSEIFEMKHRLLEFLSTEMGFDIFAIESNMPEAYLINDYVLKGEGDPKTLLSYNTPAWNTQEVLNMLKWMRNFNKSLENSSLQFTGFDMQSFYGSLRYLTDYVNSNFSELKFLTDSLSILLRNTNNAFNKQDNRFHLAIIKCDQILSCLLDLKAEYSEKINIKEINWIIQNTNVIRQYCNFQISTGKLRDKYMADNVSWILENNPDSKIVLWAHNEHITKNYQAMGEYLSRKYGKEYFSIGFSTNKGNYTAGRQNKVTTDNKLVAAVPGSFDYIFSQTGLQSFFLDLNLANHNEPNSSWLNKKMYFRTIGGNATDNQFLPATITKKFDGIIFINKTSPTKTFVQHDK